jgi:outer membrane receptor protein involved in Fe transport
MARNRSKNFHQDEGSKLICFPDFKCYFYFLQSRTQNPREYDSLIINQTKIMRSLRFLTMVLIALVSSATLWAQSVVINGNIRNNTTQEALPAVSVLVKGTGMGAFTDPNGNFRLNVDQLPVTLVISSIGYQSQEVTVNDATSTVQVGLTPSSTLGQEVVIAATRTPQRILESPVSIERLSLTNIVNTPSPSYYDALANLKGVDLTTSSLTFKTISTRGFNGSGNLRVNQLVDGMDNQAPGLNFAVGSVIGPAEIDVENVELLPGASSALYGSGGMNGTVLITSKNPFKYQGLSFQIKQGVMHLGDSLHDPSPYYDWQFRWGKTIGQRFALKLSGQFIQAQDWEAADYRDLQRNNVFSSVKPGTRQTDPNYDGVNIFGDEASTSMASFSQAVQAQVGPVGTAAINNLAAAGLTMPQIIAALQSSPSTAPLATYVPFILGNRSNIYGGQFVSRTGYPEKNLVDYNAYNLKLNAGLYYKITNSVEASLIGYWGTGTTVYTGADRYALKNLKMGQYKAEVKGTNWFLRGYTTQENSGDSYTATTAALFINRAWKSDQNWFGTYTATYADAKLQGASDIQAHALARAAADQGRFLPGTPEFKAAFNDAIHTTINNGGAKFNDATSLYHVEGQYNLTSVVKFMEVLVGASYRIYHLNSHGTIFVDTTGPINISEAGAYVQLQKSLVHDVLRLTGSLRYDKNQNFEGRVTPRATALIKVAPNNNIRLSYQTAYRFPSTQDQYINLLTGGANRLIGGLPQFNTFFHFDINPGYTAESIVAYRNSISEGTPNPGVLQQAQFRTIKPETARSYEIGFRGLVTRQLLIDVYGYYSQYKNFIGRVAVGRGQSGNPANAPVDLASPYTTDNYSFVVNTDNTVNAIGWGISFDYLLSKGYRISANFSSDQLDNVPSTIVTFFNTPKFRYNIGISNNDLGKGFGFAAQWRWQDKVYWEGTFGTGDVPAFGTLDAQISYRIRKIKSVVKLGASNLLNKYYTSAFGNPQVGGIYYVSFGYNLF